jgi:O-antigen/teichoic acid export membrane protein
MSKISLKKGFDKLWNSPTFNTWLSYSTKAFSLLIVLPLILKKFNDAEVAIWYLFSTIISLQGLIDMGFRVTFVRMIAYAKGGAKDIVEVIEPGRNYTINETNWSLINKIYSTMVFIYSRLSIFSFILLISLGSWALNKPMSFLPSAYNAWIAWAVIICVTIIKLYGTVYIAYLEGLNYIALARRIESVTSICSIFTSILILIFKADLLLLVIANQAWTVVAVIRDYFICRYVEGGKFRTFIKFPFEKPFFKQIWKPAWKSGLSSCMSNGLNNLSSVLYAQIGNSASVASYLLALRILNQIESISMAPFYSKIPTFSRLRIRGDIQELIKKAQRSMLLSHFVFLIGIITVGSGSELLIKYMHSHVKWVQSDIWLLLTFAYFIHRYGAMHMQLYNTTNHIKSHIADGVSGIIFILVSVLLIKKFQLYAIPIGMLAGYLGFYAWYAAFFSLKSLKVSFLKFEFKAAFLPLGLFFAYCLIQAFITF